MSLEGLAAALRLSRANGAEAAAPQTAPMATKAEKPNAKQVVERFIDVEPVFSAFIDYDAIITAVNASATDVASAMSALVASLKISRALGTDPDYIPSYLKEAAILRQLKSANQEGFDSMLELFRSFGKKIEGVPHTNRTMMMCDTAGEDTRRRRLEATDLDSLSPEKAQEFIQLVLSTQLPTLLAQSFNQRLFPPAQKALLVESIAVSTDEDLIHRIYAAILVEYSPLSDRPDLKDQILATITTELQKYPALLAI